MKWHATRFEWSGEVNLVDLIVVEESYQDGKVIMAVWKDQPCALMERNCKRTYKRGIGQYPMHPLFDCLRGWLSIPKKISKGAPRHKDEQKARRQRTAERQQAMEHDGH